MLSANIGSMLSALAITTTPPGDHREAAGLVFFLVEADAEAFGDVRRPCR